MGDVLLEGKGIGFAYQGTPVLHNASLSLRAGEVHAVLGENGAGKSTLLKVLAGVLVAQSGTIAVRGAVVHEPRVLKMRGLGVSMVQQHFSLQPSMTGMENLHLALSSTFLLSDAGLSKRLKKVESSLGTTLRWDVPVGELSVGEQQRIEIVRALLEGGDHASRVLILDEPTAVLTERESAALYASLKQLAAQGTAVCVVTHKLDEVLTHADGYTVLRKGYIAPPPKERTRGALVAAMMGEDVVPTERALSAPVGEVVLSLSHVRFGKLHIASLSVHAGEIVGVAGIDGNGQQELVLVASQRAKPESGVVLTQCPPALVPSDRHTEGLVLDATVFDNLLLGRHEAQGTLGTEATRATARTIMARVDEQVDVERTAKEFSGGNQQKVVVARALDAVARGARAWVIANPTRGVDVKASHAIHDAIVAASAQGTGILLVSADLDELRRLSDRILVIRDGEIAGTFAADSTEIGGAMV